MEVKAKASKKRLVGVWFIPSGKR